jgi:CheY-like chemotaxis protein
MGNVPVAAAALQPMIAVIDRDRLTAYGLALLLRDWGYQSVTGVSAEEIFGRTEAQGRRIAAIVADDRPEDGSTGEEEAAALTALADRSIPIIVLATAGGHGGEAGGVARIPKPIEPFRLRDLLRTMVTLSS